MNTPWSVTVRSETVSATKFDQYGNPLVTRADRTEPVYGWAPAGTSESDRRNEQVTHDLDLYAPQSFVCLPSDEIQVDGDWYTVEGRLEDFNHGPFGFAPGGRVKLKRVTG